MDAVVYVYAVVAATAPLGERLGELRGVAGAPVTLLPEADGDHGVSGALAFVTSDVPREDFDESALARRFEDLAWLEQVARAHHEVVRALAARTTVLPLRMATVYEDGARAGRALAEAHDPFARRLSLLRAHAEYGVKLSLPPASPDADDREPGADDREGTAATGRDAAEAEAGDTRTSAGTTPRAGPAGDDGEAHAAGTGGPGKAYLRRRQAQHRARETVRVQARRAAAALDEAAARHAAERVRHAPQRSPLSGPYENVLNDSYLVADARAEDFRTAVAEVAAAFPAVRVEVTGPWAPYSFAMPPEAEEEPA
ncbi:GvpL/GvpF family gas vesicle protein [Streptomyces sp. NPDC012421]|uniref:GvpL/GvpF family gas vesicle protein n=1 Tax=Streptomyces sp. NPDC012421 TaxID=3364832 RepID=UPI0036EC44CE